MNKANEPRNVYAEGDKYSRNSVFRNDAIR